ncbi:type III pantothenate kinase [Crenobacter sp. SG2305]|uniref:type III pantothenate kinase n=1 Tax=Crenobacter oryzisoli TaxID=3056844 RepID=UPI0025AA93E5|nr:type III pantothenate kinase [Crenobacter sp. SG2305]MDN0083812.1 type III pantothenate kinase [Crenobacter sp. SG2305]
MKLLIDAGNTRVKWALTDGAVLCDEGVVTHDFAHELAERWAGLALEAAWGASVARPTIRDAVEAACPVPVRWMSSERQRGGVTNHYRNIAEQGVDRWMAVLAARARLPGQDVVLASAGTALTVEALTAEGDYLGGLILPGFALMLKSLAAGTAQLDRLAGQWEPFPQATPDALASGALDAMAGAIERLRRRLAEQTGRAPATLVLTGGDAERLLPLLAPPCVIMDNLVIHGLLRVANET